MQMDLKMQWFLIDSEEEYQLAVDRYSKIKHSKKGAQDHKEKLLLIHLISEYEKANTTLPKIDPVELIKIRMAEFGYKSADLAEIHVLEYWAANLPGRTGRERTR